MSRESDLHLLNTILHPSNHHELTQVEIDAFARMRAELMAGERHMLSKRQRSWAEEVDARLKPIDASKVPCGREIESPWMLRPENLPKRPPGMRR